MAGSCKRIGTRSGRASAWLSLVVAATVGGCNDGGPLTPDGELPPAGVWVSEPIAGAGSQPAAAVIQSGEAALAAQGLVYVSAEPGTFPDGVSATVTNVTTDGSVTVEILDGGFDPVTLGGEPGDEIRIQVHETGGSSTEYRIEVPERQPPRVVRTRPPKDAVDVSLNANIIVVFSEPISAAALTASSTQLLLGGAPVAGTLGFGDSQHLAVTFTPAEALAPGAEYTLLITRAIEDLDGDALAAELRIGFTTATATASATRVFMQVSAGDHHTCGVTTDHVLYCWGFNFYGQLGVLGSASKTPYPSPVGGGLRFAQVSAGGERTCGVTTDGVAYCWGYNQDGQLGDGTLENRSTPSPVAGNVTFAQVSAGHEMVGGPVAGVATGGTAYCWPDCWGAVTLQPAPSPSGLTFAQVSAGAHHTCGITTNHAAYCWGINFHGEFGGGTIDSVGPTAETPVAGNLAFAQVSAGYLYTCGVTTDDLAYCWGSNGNGRLGDGTTDSRLTPTPVAGNLRFAKLSTGQLHACGVTTDDIAYCWGYNKYGELGDGTTSTRLTPTPVAGGLRFAQVTAGDNHTCGITTDDVVYCWGFNHSGQLGSRFGYDTMGNRLTPTPVDF